MPPYTMSLSSWSSESTCLSSSYRRLSVTISLSFTLSSSISIWISLEPTLKSIRRMCKFRLSCSSTTFGPCPNWSWLWSSCTIRSVWERMPDLPRANHRSETRSKICLSIKPRHWGEQIKRHHRIERSLHRTCHLLRDHSSTTDPRRDLKSHDSTTLTTRSLRKSKRWRPKGPINLSMKSVTTLGRLRPRT